MSRVPPVVASLGATSANPTGLVAGAAPPARLAYLRAVNELIHAAVTTPYASTCLVNEFDPDEHIGGNTTAERYLTAQRIAPGGMSFRGRWMHATTGGSNFGDEVEAYSAASGGTSNDEVNVESPLETGTASFPTGDQVALFWSADSWVPSPTAAQDRLFELEQRLDPYTEKFEIRYTMAFSGAVRQAEDLLTL